MEESVLCGLCEAAEEVVGGRKLNTKWTQRRGTGFKVRGSFVQVFRVLLPAPHILVLKLIKSPEIPSDSFKFF